MVGSVPDPFVQVKMLQLLCLLCEDDESVTESVMDVVSFVASRWSHEVDDLEGRHHVCGWKCGAV